MATFSERFKELRKEKGMSQRAQPYSLDNKANRKMSTKKEGRKNRPSLNFSLQLA